MSPEHAFRSHDAISSSASCHPCRRPLVIEAAEYVHGLGADRVAALLREPVAAAGAEPDAEDTAGPSGSASDRIAGGF